MITKAPARGIAQMISELLIRSPELSPQVLVGQQLKRMSIEHRRGRHFAVRLEMRGGECYLLEPNPHTGDKLMMVEPNLLVRHVNITRAVELSTDTGYRLRLLAGDKLIATVTSTDRSDGIHNPVQLYELSDPRQENT